MQIRDNLFTLSSIDDLNRCLKLHMAICNLSDLCHYIAILELAFLFSPLNVVSFPSALLSYADCIQIVGGGDLSCSQPSLSVSRGNEWTHSSGILHKELSSYLLKLFDTRVFIHYYIN